MGSSTKKHSNALSASLSSRWSCRLQILSKGCTFSMMRQIHTGLECSHKYKLQRYSQIHYLHNIGMTNQFPSVQERSKNLLHADKLVGKVPRGSQSLCKTGTYSCSLCRISLLTDHRNIFFTLSPTCFNENVARHIVHNTQRWALRLIEFDFSVEHISGERNILADMVAWWAVSHSSACRPLAAFRVPLLTEERQDLPFLEIISAEK